MCMSIIRRDHKIRESSAAVDFSCKIVYNKEKTGEWGER